MPIPVRLLADRAADLFDTTAKDILGRPRFAPIALARHAVAYAAVASGRSRRDTGRHLDGRDHSTVDNSVRQAEVFRERDSTYRARTDALVAYATEWAERHRHELVSRTFEKRISQQVRRERELAERMAA